MPSKPDAFTYTMTVRLPADTDRRIDRVLKGGEIRSAFIRTAVIKELELREKTARRAA